MSLPSPPGYNATRNMEWIVITETTNHSFSTNKVMILLGRERVKGVGSCLQLPITVFVRIDLRYITRGFNIDPMRYNSVLFFFSLCLREYKEVYGLIKGGRNISACYTVQVRYPGTKVNR